MGSPAQPATAPGIRFTAAQPANEARHTGRSRGKALGVLCTGMLLVVLDTTGVNVALPTIRTELHFSGSSLAWVVNAYLISFGGLLLLAGRLGDIVSRRRTFLGGLALFTTASLACGLAPSQNALLAARFVQGIGAAMLAAVILGMIATLFPEPALRVRAIGLYSVVLNVGGAIGLVAGGALTQSLGWHWVFFVNLPIGALSLLFGMRWLEEEAAVASGESIDLLGGILITASLVAGVFSIVGPATKSGWTSAQTLGTGAASAALLVGFAAHESRTSNPLIPLAILRDRTVAVANVVQALLTAGMFGVFFSGALYLKRVLGYDALQIGLAFLPLTAIVGLVSLRFADRLIVRRGAGVTLLAGLVIVSLALLLFARAPTAAGYLGDVLPVMVLLGVGVGLAFPSVMSLAMSRATAADAGLASGLINTTIQVAGALGLALLASLSASDTQRLQRAGRDPLSALNGGYHLAFGVCAGLVALAAAVTVGFLRAERAANACSRRSIGAAPQGAGPPMSEQEKR